VKGTSRESAESQDHETCIHDLLGAFRSVSLTAEEIKRDEDVLTLCNATTVHTLPEGERERSRSQPSVIPYRDAIDKAALSLD
jgi:hypothetical protein